MLDLAPVQLRVLADHLACQVQQHSLTCVAAHKDDIIDLTDVSAAPPEGEVLRVQEYAGPSTLEVLQAEATVHGGRVDESGVLGVKFHARYAPVAVTLAPDDEISGGVFETPELYVAAMGPEGHRIMVARMPVDGGHAPAEGAEGFVHAPTRRLLHEAVPQAVSERRLAAVREVGAHGAQLRTEPGVNDRLLPARLAEARASEHGRWLKPASLRLRRGHPMRCVNVS